MLLPAGRAVCLSVLATLAVVAYAPRAMAFDGTLVVGPTGGPGYARVLRLAHSGTANGRLLASFHVGEPGGDGVLVYQSADDGTTWTALSSMVDPAYSERTCCATIFELPAAMGTLPAGTVLLSASEGAAGAAGHEIKVWSSADQGATWTYLSSCAKTSGVAGLWEPEFQVAADGELLCYYSDETQPGHSQVLAHVASTDGGKTWGAAVNDVASDTSSDRPGMATVVRLGSAGYAMSFEVCGDGDCRSHVKTSPDGMDWTPADDLGSLLATADGSYLAHTPYLAWLPSGGPRGQLVASGWYFDTSNGVPIAAESGSVLLTNANGGAGAWSLLPAPFDFASGPNSGYSSPLLPSLDGTDVLYLAATPASNSGSELRQSTANAGILPYAAPFAGGTDSGWLVYGGTFSVADGVYADSDATAGDKSVAGSTAWTDYTLYGEVQLFATGQVGLLARVSNPGVGVDALDGYYAGLDSTTGALLFGREANGWTALGSTPVAGGVAAHQWYRVAVRAVGCSFVASAIPVGETGAPASVTAQDPSCFASGMIGVRDFLAPSQWRNIAVVAGGDACSDQADETPCTHGACVGGHCTVAPDGGADGGAEVDATAGDAAADPGNEGGATPRDASASDASSGETRASGSTSTHASSSSSSSSESSGQSAKGCSCDTAYEPPGPGAACGAMVLALLLLDRRRRRGRRCSLCV